jgi:nitrile hydratase beta subunit
MNGIHDMGGMHGLGPLEIEKNEPVFHEEWEGRTYAMTRSVNAWRKWTIDGGRHAIENFPAAEYLRMSYYEKWFTRMGIMLRKYGMISQTELETGVADAKAVKMTPTLTVDRVPSLVLNSHAVSIEDAGIVALFEVGQRVRAKNMNPAGHTRLPRYARGRVGVIDRDHGVQPFPDTAAHGLGEKRQHVYSVRFAARELWGEEAPARDSVFIDLWDDYLEHG